MIFRILEDQLAEQSKQSKAADARFMQLALTLGRRGQGRTWPNPAVGAVVSRTVSLLAAAGRNRAAVPTPSRRL
jgi:pyrimidine deaminase RibD-like protein